MLKHSKNKRIFYGGDCRTLCGPLFAICLLCLALCSLSGCGRKEYNWAFDNDGRSVNGTKGSADVDIDWCETDSDNICIVAIIDCGIVNEMYSEYGFDVVSGEKIEPTLIVNEHATQIASIIDRNFGGQMGISRHVKLINIRLEEEDMSPERLIEAIQYAENMGARVVNCSFCVNWESDELEDIMRASSMLFVCAAGNRHEERAEYPACLTLKMDNVVSVGAINNFGLVSSHSNYGDDIDVLAPGENVSVKNRDGSEVIVNGSSYATAYVTGCVAECLALYPDITAGRLKEGIIESVKKIATVKNYVKSDGVISLRSLLDYFTFD